MTELNRILPWWDPEDRRKYRSVIWNLTRRCNRNCSYCPFHDTTSETLPGKHLEFIASVIRRKILLDAQEDLDYCQVVLFGGEPTMVPQDTLLQIVSTLSDFNVLMYSNLQASAVKYHELIEAGLSTVMASYHGANDDQRWKFVRKAEQLADLHLQNQIHFLVMSDTYDAYQVLHRLKDTGFQADMFQSHRDDTVPPKQPKKSEKKELVVDTDGWKSLVHRHRNHFKKWHCLAGCNHVYIECDGTVYPCQGIGHACYTGKLEGGDYARGNILTEIDPPFWGDEIESCPVKACRFEAGITKYR